MRTLFVLLLAAATFADSYKILVYNSLYGHSHSSFMGRIADVLVEAGHNVTSLISEVDPEIVGAATKSHTIHVEQGAATAEFMSKFSYMKRDLFSYNNYNPLNYIFLGEKLSTMFEKQCRAVLDKPELIEMLRAEYYDVMITENNDMCGTALTELVKPKSIILTYSSMMRAQQYEEFGVPTALSYNPEPSVSGMNVHSIWDRAVNIYANILFRCTLGSFRSKIDALFREKFGPNFPSLMKISSNAAYVFINTEPLIDFAAPTMSKVINIGGIGVKEPKKLSEEWEEILSMREKTVLLSFGSIIKSAFMPAHLKMSVIETVKSLPNVTFIWKYEIDDSFTNNTASMIPNLELTKWMPQTDLLAHPRLSAFITHGGMGSTQETAWSGVPGIFVPLFGDQLRNADNMEYNGIGKVMNKHDFGDPAKLTAVVREVLYDESYRNNANRVAAMLSEKPYSFRDQIVKYTQFAAKFGPSKALRPHSHDMSWIAYHNFDIKMIAMVFILLLAKIVYKVTRILIVRLRRNAEPIVLHLISELLQNAKQKSA